MRAKPKVHPVDGPDREMADRIGRILMEVRDPESRRPIAELNLVRRVRVSTESHKVYLDVPFDDHTPGCMTCAGIAMTIVAGLKRELTEAFEREFAGYSVEYI